jgi:hypothetical protein
LYSRSKKASVPHSGCSVIRYVRPIDLLWPAAARSPSLIAARLRFLFGPLVKERVDLDSETRLERCLKCAEG